MIKNFFKYKNYQLIAVSILVGFLCTSIINIANAQAEFVGPPNIAGTEKLVSDGLTDAGASAADIATILTECAPDIAKVTPTPNGGIDNTTALISCMQHTLKRDVIEKWKEQLREEFLAQADKTFKDSIAIGFKTSLRSFLQQFSHDVSTWIASGGKGQKPLFVTEGWGAYLRNSADEALGTFIDSVDQEFGTNLCRPNFQVRIGMIRGLEQSMGKAPRKPKCNFTEIVSNWQSAVRNPQLMTEYTNFLQPGNNDISSFLMLQTGLGKSIDAKLNEKTLGAVTGDGWKDLTDKIGNVLTPGTAIRHQFEKTSDEAIEPEKIFTGTVWDFIESFLNSLMAGLLNNLQTGLFASDSGSDKSKFNLPNLQGLLKYEAAPYVEGRQGAKERFSTLIESQVRVGGSYNVLVKLTQCTDAAKTNLGPTDCVLDQGMSDAIRNKKLVKQLDKILDRPFAPASNQVVEPQTAFTLRNIVIMRKYRIVPVGWEIAARHIASQGTADTKSYTLRDIMNAFNSCSDGKPTATAPFCGLIDPNWVLKAPELFCRREGFGEKNDSAKSQDGTVQRAQYCADEQQCLEEDDAGNCLVYGYCTTERRSWDFTGKTCEPLYNTCQTVTSRTGKTDSYLANSLDYRNCNSQNAGCTWYSGVFNPTDNKWSHTSDTIYKAPVGSDAGEGVSVNTKNQTVLEYHTSSSTKQTNELAMDSPCSPASCTAANKCTFTPRSGATPGKCTFETGQNCTIAKGATRCSLTTCTENRNLFDAANGSFSSCAGWNAAGWVEGYLGDNNKHSCLPDTGVLQLFAINNVEPIVTRSAEISVVKGQRYQFTFAGKTNLSVGGVVVNILANGTVANSIEIRKSTSEWQTYSIGDYIVAPSDKLTIEIVTQPGAIGQATLDNFSLKPEASSCAGQSVWLTTANNIDSKPDLGTMRYFDRDIESCDGKDAGCHQFIRTAAGLSSNILPNSSFEIADPANAAQAMAWSGTNALRSDNTVRSGGQAVQLDIVAGTGSTDKTTYSYSNLIDLRTRSKYAFSAYVNPTNDTLVAVKFNTTDIESTPQMVRANVWTQVSDILITDGNFAARPEIVVYGTTSAGRIYVDDAKLEEVTYNATRANDYTAYGASDDVATLKKAPDHYQCYDANTATPNIEWPQDITALNSLPTAGACSNYAQACLLSEVGCELYTPVNKIDPNVPGRLTQADYCPVETRDGVEYGICDGYQVYKQEQTNFTIGKYTQFIADNQANYCSAAYVGCDAFTNLDAVAAGGESTAYFSQVRACQKPAPDGRNYYTWEGSDTTGYQLKAYTLKASNNSNAPCTVMRYNVSGGNVCANTIDETSVNVEQRAKEGICSADEEKTNADCRAFYDTLGGKHYRLLSKTIANTNECVPFRRNQTQGDLVQARADCDNTGGRWQENACIYDVVPSQGRQCNAAAVGCREYTGNRGNNVRNLFNDSFEAGAGIWSGGTLSNNTNYPGGTSLGSNNLELSRPVRLTKGHAYQLSFWAKADAGSVNLSSVRFQGSNKVVDMFALRATADVIPATGDRTQSSDDQLRNPNITIGGEWQRYDLGPVFVTWSGTDVTQETFDDHLVIDVPTGKIYIDNVVLKEIQQKVYVIENSWETPVACDNPLNDPDGAKAIAFDIANPTNPDKHCQTTPNTLGPSRCAPGEMIGCQAYTNRASQVAHVKSFDKICRPGAVGCEMMIDTHNSASPFAETYLPDDAASKISTPADNFVYLVNDRKYACSAGARGCTAFGLPIINAYDEVTGYNNVYLKDQPDRYSTDVCQQEQLWCEEYTTGRSTVYFKDPRSKLCEYRTDTSTTTVDGIDKLTTQTNWFQKGTNSPCVTSNFQTVGKSAPVKQPVGWFSNEAGVETNKVTTDNKTDDYAGWAGVCPASANSCSEFIDPLAQNYNDVFQKKMKPSASERVTLRSFTLYTVSVENAQGDVAVDISCNNTAIWSPDASMPGGRLAVTNIEGERTISGRFYIGAKVTGSCTVTMTASAVADPAVGIPVTIAKAGTYYSLANSIDRTSCNGVVDYNEGCVPVNDRSALSYAEGDIIKRNQDYLSIDADATYNQQMSDPDQHPVQPQRPPANLLTQRNANSVIKGTPDRVCDAWLYCTTYEKSSQSDDSRVKSLYGNYDRCLDVGLCTGFNDRRECANLITDDNLAENNAAAKSYDKTDAYRSGYSLVGEKDVLSVPVYYPTNEMKQAGGSANIVNGNFESVFGTNEPIGWSVDTNQSSGIILAGFEGVLGTPKTRPNTSWTADRFSVVNDVKQAPEGGRYLRLNSYFTAQSADIDVAVGTEYTLSAWINTLDLKSSSDPVKAQLLIADKDGNLLPATSDDKRSGGEALGGNLAGIAKPAGQNWEYVTYRFKPSSQTITIRLESYINPGVQGLCKDSERVDNINGCPITGFAKFDNIELKPVLNSSQDTAISRSCRMYPAQNALSCQYSDGNNNFYGQYGYCLTIDPINPKQCLQWFPIDQLEGELSSELTGYAGRRPLYYCVEKKKANIDLKTMGLSANMGKNFWDSADNVTKVVDFNNDVSVLQFPIPLDYRSLIRWPYIQRLDFRGVYLGFGKDLAVWPLPMHSRMYVDKTCPSFLGILDVLDDAACYKSKISNNLADTNDSFRFIDKICTEDSDSRLCGFIAKMKSMESPFEFIPEKDSWGGWGMIGFGLKSIPIPIAIPLPWHAASGSKLVGLFGSFGDLFGGDFGGSGSFGMKIITDQDETYKGAVPDPVPGLPGDILGVAQFLDTSGDFAAGGVTGGVTGYVTIEYCSQMVEVVDPAGSNKAWLARTSRGSGYVSPDRDCAVYPHADKLFDFFDNPKTEENGGYEGDFKPGQWPYSLNLDVNGKVMKGARDKDLCAVQEESLYTIIGYNYQEDYPPFGAIVQPGNSQYPDGWDSKDAQGIQPLYYEIQNPEIPIPGQPRMGQLHSIADLKGLFAKVYSIWRWDDGTNAYKKEKNTTVQNGSGSSITLEPWNVPSGPGDGPGAHCANNIRPAGAGQSADDNQSVGRDDFCYVNPLVTAVKVSPNTVPGYGPVELNFRAVVDPDQLPIRSYTIDWGDGGKKTTMSGLALRDRANNDNPFVLYHFYDYKQANCPVNEITCTLEIKVTVTDNWGAASTSQGQISILNSDAY